MDSPRNRDLLVKWGISQQVFWFLVSLFKLFASCSIDAGFPALVFVKGITLFIKKEKRGCWKDGDWYGLEG